jgi:hypothetical protein
MNRKKMCFNVPILGQLDQAKHVAMKHRKNGPTRRLLARAGLRAYLFLLLNWPFQLKSQKQEQTVNFSTGF